MANDSKIVPVPVLRRMPAYLSFVKTLQKQGEKYVSSTRIAEYMEIDATQVTKDLSHTGISGKTRVGYEVDNFVEILDDFLGFNKINNAFLVGAGSLGCALLQDKGGCNVAIGIITVPAECAQNVADLMVAWGIKAIWNFTPARIKVPAHIAVQNTTIYTNLAILFNKLHGQE